MYKYEPYIKEFLLQHKEVSLEQIGVFKTGATILSEENKAQNLSSVIFEYNRRSATSLALLAFIADKESKNRQIISIDFDSFLNEMRQLLNTGKEVAIDGLGFLFINKKGEYEFVQQTAVSKTENARRKVQHQDIEKFKQAASGKKKGSASIAIVSLLLIVLFIGATGWGIYNIFFDKPDSQIVSSVNMQPSSDSEIKTNVATPVFDSSSKKINDTTISSSDSASYKFIFETTSDQTRAYSRILKLKEYGDPALVDSIKTDTAMIYRLFIEKKILAADTVKTKDSIAKYFQRDIIIDKAN